MRKLGILGASGKLGQAVLQLAADASWTVTAIEKGAALQDIDIALDVSHPDACERHLLLAKEAKVPLVIGTTGLSAEAHALIQTTSSHIPLLYAANFSIGIALMTQFLKTYSPFLHSGYIDIFEQHHTEKKDLPSGTALTLAHLFDKKKISIHTPAHRTQEDLVIHSARIPSHPGEHLVQCRLADETLSMHHLAHSRLAYAKGALLAASFLLSKPPGLYEFADVFAAENYLSPLPSIS